LSAYIIKPLVLCQYLGETSAMTYMTYAGKKIFRPFVMWYIRADGKNVLVDTSMEAEDFKNYHPAYSHLHIEHIQTFDEALAKVECVPSDIDIIIQTHLHMDHVYNTCKCANATVFVQKFELQFALNPHPIFEVIYPTDMIRNLHFKIIEGDQSILPGIAVKLHPGHSPGCQTVFVDTPKGKAAITGFCSIMENFNVPADVKETASPLATYPAIAAGIHTDLFQAYDSAVRLKSLADIIIPSHDPEMAFKKQIP
jgi:glyoxylase-like metal-dependent hydrolase (beta-lactamase superfamily II)